MRIKMLDSESTRVEGRAFHFLAGREYDLPDNIARAWITKRIAEKVTKRPTTKREKGD